MPPPLSPPGTTARVREQRAHERASGAAGPAAQRPGMTGIAASSCFV